MLIVILFIQAKLLAAAEVFTSARDLVTTARDKVIVGADVATVNEQCLVRRANRVRCNLRPAEPKDMDFVVRLMFLQIMMTIEVVVMMIISAS
jgi:hypothetical protein